MKSCTCCHRSFTLEQWSALPLCGPQDDGVECLELRNCHCGTTLAIVLFAWIDGKATLLAEQERDAA